MNNQGCTRAALATAGLDGSEEQELLCPSRAAAQPVLPPRHGQAAGAAPGCMGQCSRAEQGPTVALSLCPWELADCRGAVWAQGSSSGASGSSWCSWWDTASHTPPVSSPHLRLGVPPLSHKTRGGHRPANVQKAYIRSSECLSLNLIMASCFSSRQLLG